MWQSYELTEETKKYRGKTLYRIRAVTDFGGVKKGQLGGWIESENNLRQDDVSWVADDAIVMGKARVEGQSRIDGKAIISGNTLITTEREGEGFCNVHITDTKIGGDSRINGDITIKGNYTFKNITLDCCDFWLEIDGKKNKIILQ